MPKAGDHGSYEGASNDWDDYDDLNIDYIDDGDDSSHQGDPDPVLEPAGYQTISGKFGKSSNSRAAGTTGTDDPENDPGRRPALGVFGQRGRGDSSKPRRDPEDPSSKLRLMKGKSPNKILIGLVVAAGLVIAITTFGGSSDSDDDTSADETESVLTETNNSVFDPNDPPGTIKDNRNGNHDTAVDAIRGYLWEYYINKDSDAARSYYAPASKITESDIKAGIDNTAEGIRYNVAITSNGTEVYDVVLTLLTQDGKSQDYKQQYTMTKENGQFYIQRFTSV